MLSSGRGAWPVIVLFLLPACGADEDDPPRAWRVYSVTGFDQPESVVYDAEQDLFFVSSMAGLGSDPNGMGYISRFRAGDPGRVEPFAVGGMAGAVLHSPKGMAIQDETLWVADIDVLRGFDRRTGDMTAAIDLGPYGAVLLNAIAIGPDTAVYVTDTGIIMSEIGVVFSGGSKILRVGPGGNVELLAEGEDLAHPNGISWDSVTGRMLVASFAPFLSDIYGIDLDGVRDPQPLARGPGRYDGLAAVGDGRFVYTSWSDSSLWLLGEDEPVRLARDLWQAADVGVDTRRGRIAVPLVLPGRVEVWQLADLAESGARTRGR